MKPFEIRGFNPCESLLRHTPEQIMRFIRRMKKLNMNTIIIHYDYGWKRYKDIILKECEKANIEIILMTFGPRTFLSYSDWDKKWFSKKEDGTLFNDRLECETSLCAFEQGVIEAYEYGAKQWLRSLPPQIRHVHMRAADGLNFCQCEKCRGLPDHEKWQPFVDIFVKAVVETRPELKFETDVYVKRYGISNNSTAFSKMTNVMFDTFYRHTAYPIGDGGDISNAELLNYATTFGEKTEAKTPNEYYLERISQWNASFPDKVYIHENAMKQSYFGTFQYGTYSYLKDLDLYRRLGVKGVCYEAYEPGYTNFSQMFDILARYMNGEEIEYTQTDVEREISKTSMNLFCNQIDFPLEEYISDPFQLKCTQLYRRFWLEHTPELYREYVDFAFENKEVLDYLFIGFAIADWGVKWGKLRFKDLSIDAREMLYTNKLWDYMEAVSLDQDPISICSELILELAKKAEKI